MLRWRLFVFIWTLKCAASIGYAQSPQSTPAAPNPYEIVSRLPKTMVAGTLAISANVNPYDVKPHRPPGANTALSVADKSVKSSGAYFKLPTANTLPDQFIFWILTAFTVFFTFSVAANRGAFWKAWRGFLSDTAFNSARREASSMVGNTPYYMMYLSFLLNAGLFLFLIVLTFNDDKKYHNLSTFVACMIGVAALFLSRQFLLKFVGWLFPKAEATMEQYNFLIIIFNCVLGFFLVPFNFLVAFGADKDQQLFSAFWTLGLGAIFLLYQSFRGVLIGSKFLSGSLFHFLLYLCAVEIAPIALLVKFFF
jgi:hypothetical protein